MYDIDISFHHSNDLRVDFKTKADYTKLLQKRVWYYVCKYMYSIR